MTTRAANGLGGFLEWGRTNLAAGVLPCFAGVAVHDAWTPYDTYKFLLSIFEAQRSKR